MSKRVEWKFLGHMNGSITGPLDMYISPKGTQKFVNHANQIWYVRKPLAKYYNFKLFGLNDLAKEIYPTEEDYISATFHGDCI